MNGSKVHLFLFVLIGNYFFTLLIIGLIAGLISLLSKPRPRRTSTVAEAFLSLLQAFPHRHKQPDQLRFPRFLRRYGSKVYRLGQQPVSGGSGIRKSRHRHCRSHCIQSKFTIPIRHVHSTCRFLVRRGRGHIYQMIAAHNFSPGNVGLVLPSDIIIPVVGFVFLWLSYRHPKSEAANDKVGIDEGQKVVLTKRR